VINPELMERYIQHPEIQLGAPWNVSSKMLLFHGAGNAAYAGISKDGFKDEFIGKANDQGYFGKGHYFTSFPQYSLKEYAKDHKTLIASHVNVGVVKDVTKEGISVWMSKKIPPNRDSHYVKCNSHSATSTSGKFDEWIVKKGQTSRILPRYIIRFGTRKNVVVWRDANIANSENDALLQVLKGKPNFNIYGATTTKEALEIINIKRASGLKVIVISNGADDGEGFVRGIQALGRMCPVCIFCSAVAYHQSWAVKCTADAGVPFVTESSSEVETFILSKLIT